MVFSQSYRPLMNQTMVFSKATLDRNIYHVYDICVKKWLHWQLYWDRRVRPIMAIQMQCKSSIILSSYCSSQISHRGITFQNICPC